MVNNVAIEDDETKIQKIKAELDELTSKKERLIKDITRITKEIKYKGIELNVLKDLAKKADETDAEKIIKTLKKLEFKFETSQLNPKKEKSYYKKIVELERKVKEVEPYLKAKKRVKVLEDSIKKLKEEMQKIDESLKDIRGKINKLLKEKKRLIKRKKMKAKRNEMLSLEDVVEIEE